MLKRSNGQFICTLLFTNFIRCIFTFLPLFLLIIKNNGLIATIIFFKLRRKRIKKKTNKNKLGQYNKRQKNRETIGGIPQMRILCEPFMSILMSLYTKHIEIKEL